MCISPLGVLLELLSGIGSFFDVINSRWDLHTCWTERLPYKTVCYVVSRKTHTTNSMVLGGNGCFLDGLKACLYMTRVLKLTCVNWARFHGDWWAPARKGFELHWNLIATKISCVNGPLGKRADTEKIKYPRKNGQRYVHLVNEFLFTSYAFDRSFAFACLCFLLVWNITPVKLLFSWKLLKLCVI